MRTASRPWRQRVRWPRCARTEALSTPLDSQIVVLGKMAFAPDVEGNMTIFGAGRYVDRVARDGGGWKFASKTVVLDSRQIDTLLAIPI